MGDSQSQDIIIRTLEFYCVAKIKVHIRILNGYDAGLFRNGLIIGVYRELEEFSIFDDVRGLRTYKFSQVSVDSIEKFREVGE